jgi:hypothetical protein
MAKQPSTFTPLCNIQPENSRREFWARFLPFACQPLSAWLSNSNRRIRHPRSSLLPLVPPSRRPVPEMPRDAGIAANQLLTATGFPQSMEAAWSSRGEILANSALPAGKNTSTCRKHWFSANHQIVPGVAARRIQLPGASSRTIDRLFAIA